MGTHLLTMDLIAARLYGLDPLEVPWIREAVRQGLGPADLSEIRIQGDLSLRDLGRLGEQVIRPDPLPERYPWPPQVRVFRSEAEPLWNIPGALMETLWVLEHGGISLAKAREAAIVIGSVGELPGRGRTRRRRSSSETPPGRIIADTAGSFGSRAAMSPWPGSCWICLISCRWPRSEASWVGGSCGHPSGPSCSVGSGPERCVRPGCR